RDKSPRVWGERREESLAFRSELGIGQRCPRIPLGRRALPGKGEITFALECAELSCYYSGYTTGDFQLTRKPRAIRLLRGYPRPTPASRRSAIMLRREEARTIYIASGTRDYSRPDCGSCRVKLDHDA
ncbi:hypothetical protein DBV15_03899, partial [Temnothorax longispinosus]